jgi:hypothetical protein
VSGRAWSRARSSQFRRLAAMCSLWSIADIVTRCDLARQV